MSPKFFASRRLTLSIAGCVLLLLSIASSSAQQKPKVTGFFSNMHYIPGSGDVLGTEIWIVYAREKFYAAVQAAEGEPDPPIVVPIEVSGSRVKFTVKQPPISTAEITIPEVITHYSGVVTKTGLMLSIEGNPATLLKRQSSYWQ